MKISGSLGAERLNESQHKGRHHVSFQLDLSCDHMVCTQMHSKINKQVNNTQKDGPNSAALCGNVWENVMTIFVQRFGDWRNMFV